MTVRLSALLLLIIFLPIFIFVFITIFIEDGFPIFFTQKRIGINYTYFKIAINNSENEKKEWIIYNPTYNFYSKKWNPIRIPFETYDKILLGDDSEGPDLIGVKGNDKTIFSLDFEHHKIFRISKLNFYGDANFLETNKTYFPFNYGRIVPYKLEKSSQCPENCNHKSPFCNSGKIVYRYSDGDEIKGYGSNDTINLYNEICLIQFLNPF